MDLHALRGNDKRIKPWAERVTPIEHARKMVAAYAAQGWEVERAWWQRKLEERERQSISI